MMILIQTQGSNTSVELIDGLPDLSKFSEPTLSILQSAFDDGNYVGIPDVAPVLDTTPKPLDFRNKLYGLIDSSEANQLFHQVYIPTTLIATNPATSNAALTEARNILEGSLWNEPFSKPAFSNQFGSGSFDILKNFLTPEQIAICQSEAENFNLI